MNQDETLLKWGVEID